MPDGRVLVAFDDGPLEPSPVWTRLDGNDFPSSFVSGYDTDSGRQTLTSSTDAGEATVYINDNKEGLFDDRNTGSPYFGKLSGRQILLQLFNPVTAIWEPQWRGLIDDYAYDIDPAVTGRDAAGNPAPLNANIQLQCVDMFAYLAGYGLTPGLDGAVPPTGSQSTIYYAATSGTVDDRMIEVLTDAHIDPAMYLIASGNVKLIAAMYGSDRAALDVLRDCADAELPFIGMIFCDRRGRFNFRGRYSRFAPDDVAAEPGSTWDFTRWAVGDGSAIQADSSRAQMRVLSYANQRSDLINAAQCYPQGLADADMPGQVYADTTSITTYGKHQTDPISNLLTGDYGGPGTITPNTGTKQCALYAELIVKNKKDPRVAITSLQLKSIRPDDPRASATWGVITQADISHIVNVAVGYPGGVGFAGTSPDDDYYIEGRSLQVRPLNPDHDYVELDLETSPAVWSMDTHGVFPAFGT